jgi:hypothetical protein
MTKTAQIKFDWSHGMYRSDASHGDYSCAVLTFVDPDTWRAVITGPGIGKNPVGGSYETREIAINVVETYVRRHVAAMRLIETGGA